MRIRWIGQESPRRVGAVMRGSPMGGCVPMVRGREDCEKSVNPHCAAKNHIF